MGSDWVLEAGGWAVAGVAAGAGLAAWALYRVYHSEGGLRRSGRWALGALRFATLAAIGVLLLAPLIRQVTEEIERPVAVVLVDDSRSVVLDGDSAEVVAEMRAWTEGIRTAFDARGVEAAVYRFSGEVTPESGDWSGAGEESNLGRALEEMKDRFEHRNIKGMVLISDGRVNRGVDPEYGVDALAGVPVWTVGVGDTTDRADRRVVEVACNRVAYLGNRFPVEAVVGFRGATVAPLEVTVSHAGQILVRETWTPARSEDVKRFAWLLEATSVGTQRYEIAVSVGADERIVSNNRAVVYVEVLERQKSVVVAARAPHPDLGTVIATLAAQEAYSISLHHERLPHPTWEADLKAADLIIVHDLEPGSDWIEEIRSSQAPVWWMAAGAPSLQALTSLDLGASFHSREIAHRVHGIPSEGFTLFQWPEAAGAAFRAEPPLLAPLGEWELSPAWSPAIQVRLGGLISEEPLMAFRNVSGDRRWAFSVGSGWWNWRLNEGLVDESAPAMTAWVASTVQYLTSRSDVRRFRMDVPKQLTANQPLVARAEVYDGALTPLEGSRVEMVLTTPEGNELQGTFSEVNANYRIDWGKLPSGVYSWRAQVVLEGEVLASTGEVAIESSTLEFTADRADHALLVRLAGRSGGRFMGPLQAASPDLVAEAVVAQSGAQPIRFEEVQLMDAVEWSTLLWLLILFVSVEWIFRRRTLGY